MSRVARVARVASHRCEFRCRVDMGAIGQVVDIVARFRGVHVEIASPWSVRVRAAPVLASEVRKNARAR